MTEFSDPLLLIRVIGLAIITGFWAWVFYPSVQKVERTLKSWMDQGYKIQDYSEALKKTKSWLLAKYVLMLGILIVATLLSLHELLRDG